MQSTFAPYKGLRVLDVSQGFAGPHCGGILARSGASVIKVEPPSGDWARGIGGALEGHTAFSMVPNRGTRAICIDAARADGRAVLKRLADKADVVIQNFRPGVVARLGIADEQLRPDNPGLVYLSVLGFGAGPYANLPATDAIIQGYTGMMVMNRDARNMPRRIGMLAVDTAAGVYAAQQVGAALYARLAGKGGCHIKVSLAEVAAAFQAMPILDAAMHKDRPSPPLSVPIGTFATAEGHINLSCISTAMFHGICRTIGREDWISDPRLTTEAGRLSQAAEITQVVTEILAGRPSAHWLKTFAAQDVLCGPVNDYDMFLTDPHVRQSGMVAALQGGAFTGMPLVVLPGTAASASLLPIAASIGADTRDVLAEHGFEASEIEILIAAGAVTDGENKSKRETLR